MLFTLCHILPLLLGLPPFSNVTYFMDISVVFCLFLLLLPPSLGLFGSFFQPHLVLNSMHHRVPPSILIIFFLLLLLFLS